MMGVRVETTRFGTVEVEDVYDLPEGIPGLEGRRFALIPDPETPLVTWFQSLHDPAVALPIVDPSDLPIEYDAEAKPSELYALLGPDEPVSTLRRRVVIQEGERPGEILLNLFAPLYLHPERRVAVQVALVGSGCSIRHPCPPRTEAPEPEDA